MFINQTPFAQEGLGEKHKTSGNQGRWMYTLNKAPEESLCFPVWDITHVEYFAVTIMANIYWEIVDLSAWHGSSYFILTTSLCSRRHYLQLWTWGTENWSYYFAQVSTASKHRRQYESSRSNLRAWVHKLLCCSWSKSCLDGLKC